MINKFYYDYTCERLTNGIYRYVLSTLIIDNKDVLKYVPLQSITSRMSDIL